MIKEVGVDDYGDVLTKEQRRKNMQHIKSKDTKIEVILRKSLWNKGIEIGKIMLIFLDIWILF